MPTAGAPLTGLTRTAFAEMAEWRGGTPAPCDDRGSSSRAALYQKLGELSNGSGPGSPLREGPSSLPLELELEEIPFDVDEALLATGAGGKHHEPVTARRGRKRQNGEVEGTKYVVPTPKKASPDGRDTMVGLSHGASATHFPFPDVHTECFGIRPPSRAGSRPSTSLSGFTRRISFTTPPFGGRPGSSLGNMSVECATAGSSASRADTASFMKAGRARSVSPFMAINSKPSGTIDTLQKINLMVNRTPTPVPAPRGRGGRPASTGPRSQSRASTAPSPAPSMREGLTPVNLTTRPTSVVKSRPASVARCEVAAITSQKPTVATAAPAAEGAMTIRRVNCTPSPAPEAMPPPAGKAPARDTERSGLNTLFGSPVGGKTEGGGAGASSGGAISPFGNKTGGAITARPASRGATMCSFGSGLGGALSPTTTPSVVSTGSCSLAVVASSSSPTADGTTIPTGASTPTDTKFTPRKGGIGGMGGINFKVRASTPSSTPSSASKVAAA